MRQEISRITIVGAKNYVSPAIGLSNNGVRAREQRFHRSFVTVHLAALELGFQIFFQREIQESIEHVFVLLAGNVGNAFSYQAVVFSQRRLEDELQIPTPRKIAGEIG